MTDDRLDGYAAVDRAEALRILTAESGAVGDEEAKSEIATILGREPPALRWAGSLARTTGWHPLRQRLASWKLLPGLLGESRLPWHVDVQRVQDSLPASEAKLLATLSACDAPFAWDVLDAVEPSASIESVCLLEDAGLLTRLARAGVVTFYVPYCVRAIRRVADPDGAETCAIRWLEAWAKRAEDLRSTSYGVSSRATLSELASAVPLAERALFDPDPNTRGLGLALWIGTADAMFFARAIDFASNAFTRAVIIADAGGTLAPRVQARLVAGRSLLEQGDPGRAESLFEGAIELAETAERDNLRSEALRGLGWTKLASAQLEAARSSFETAQGLSDPADDPRGHADATAGLGVRALLEGDMETARALLAEALATHVVTRDGPREDAVRGMMVLLPEQLGEPVDVARLSRQVDELRSSGQRWREALVLARLGLLARARGDAVAERAHLLEARAAAALSRMSASKLVATQVETRSSESGINVGFEGRSLRLASGNLHDLSRHGPLRRMLWALAVAKSRQPGTAMSTLELVEAGWPGEKMKHEAATLRVYTTIRRLRGLGLGHTLLTRDDGYLLDPDTVIALEGA